LNVKNLSPVSGTEKSVRQALILLLDNKMSMR